jgi:oligopeptide/dipeptide ABC transporter ATP-binding protein
VNVLEVEHLQVDFVTRRGTVHAVRDVSFTIAEGETLGLVGESGSGKSVTAQALLGMIELPGRIVGGDVRWKGESLVSGPHVARTIERVRGREIAMVFQDPMTSLDPVFTIGSQMSEVLRRHRKMSRKEARARAVELLDMVGIANPAERVTQYPFEMSGGMRQRVLIAMAMACEPKLLVADEPTTALDVTIQAQILELVAELQQRLNVAVLLITHDLGVVAGVCDRVAVMYAGKIVEDASAADLYAEPAHPYTAGLLRSTPRLDIVLDRLVAIDGAPPDLRRPPRGCSFAARCPHRVAHCRQETPELELFGHGSGVRQVACFRAEELFTPVSQRALADRPSSASSDHEDMVHE